ARKTRAAPAARAVPARPGRPPESGEPPPTTPPDRSIPRAAHVAYHAPCSRANYGPGKGAMSASGNDSLVFRDIFGTEPMRRIFSDEARVQYYLDIEAALARVQARLGIIPPQAAEEIVRHCRADQFDFAALKAGTERIGYPVLPVVQQLVALCRDGLGEWCHWGATTQDITDTATVLQIRAALLLVEQDLREIAGSLAALATRYRATPMPGRSNRKNAVPV